MYGRTFYEETELLQFDIHKNLYSHCKLTNRTLDYKALAKEFWILFAVSFLYVVMEAIICLWKNS